jgi:hypothetical protein
MVLLLLYDIEKSYVNAGMSECWRKVSPASSFLPVVCCLSPASGFSLVPQVTDFSGIAQLWRLGQEKIFVCVKIH